MPNLSSFHTINDLVKKYKSDYSLESYGIAFDWFALDTILKLNEDDIEDAITDGSMDGGIDAVYIVGRDVHIFNFKYTEIYDKTKNNFPASEIDKIIVTTQSIYDKSLGQKDVNEALWEKVNEIWENFDKGKLHFKFHLCSNKLKPTTQAISKFEKALIGYRYVEFFYYDQEDLVSKLFEKNYKKLSGQIKFVDRQYFERSDGPLKGIVATVAVQDLLLLIQDPEDPNKIIEDVFNENVRIYLKLKNRINQSIYDTAVSDDNYSFWYLNNGITLLCEECNYIPNSRSPQVDLKNFQIVNGGQTTHALFEAFIRDPEKIKDVLVLVRICETKKENKIGERISETTNSQTPIRTRDLHSNDRIQRKLEEQFKTLGYFYERKKNQHSDQPKSFRLDNELLGQIYLAYYLDMPSEAKNQKQIVFGDKYDDIFDENEITASLMLKPYNAFLPLEKMKRVIQTKKRKKELVNEREAFISRAIYHLLNVIKIIEEKEQLDFDQKKDIDYAIKKSIQFVSKVVKSEIKNRGELYTHDKFFKEINTNKIISNFVLNQY